MSILSTIYFGYKFPFFHNLIIYLFLLLNYYKIQIPTRKNIEIENRSNFFYYKVFSDKKKKSFTSL